MSMNQNQELSLPHLTLGERLKKARVDSGVDQIELAFRLGIARNTLSGYETNRSVPPFDVVIEWAQLTMVKLDWFADAYSNVDDMPMRTYVNPRWAKRDVFAETYGKSRETLAKETPKQGSAAEVADIEVESKKKAKRQPTD